MKQYDRGEVVDFDSVFTTTAGVVLEVTGATLTLQHPLDGFPLWNGTHSTSYTMTATTPTTAGVWHYSWDSAPSGPGTVSWHITTSSTQAKAKSGQFLIRSNPAATWLHGPSTVAANDE